MVGLRRRRADGRAEPSAVAAADPAAKRTTYAAADAGPDTKADPEAYPISNTHTYPIFLRNVCRCA